MYQRELIFAVLIFLASEAHALEESEIAETTRGLVDEVFPLLVSAILDIEESSNRKELTDKLTNAFTGIIAEAETERFLSQVITEFAIAIERSKDSSVSEEIRKLFSESEMKYWKFVKVIAKAIASVTGSEIAGGIRSGIPKILSHRKSPKV